MLPANASKFFLLPTEVYNGDFFFLPTFTSAVEEITTGVSGVDICFCLEESFGLGINVFDLIDLTDAFNSECRGRAGGTKSRRTSSAGVSTLTAARAGEATCFISVFDIAPFRGGT